MGTDNQENVQLVISHLEGCAGNFLGRLYADYQLDNQALFRIDVDLHPLVLATDRNLQPISQLSEHTVVVTHNFDIDLLSRKFPAAKIIQIYPYTHIGNVLYNICFKKLTVNMDNVIDNHLLHIQEWFEHLQSQLPTKNAIDYWQLTDQQYVEELLGMEFNPGQQKFFKNYWERQLPYELSFPDQPTTIEQLITNSGIDEYFDPWAVAWAIFVYEKSNNLRECQRTWSVDTAKFDSWNDVKKIQYQYT